MSESGGVVDRLAEAVVDGEPIEWDQASALVQDSLERSRIEQLRAIENLSGRSRDDGEWNRSFDGRFGSPAWAVLLLLVALQVVVGLALTLGYGAVFPSRFASSQFAIGTSFAVAALFLVWGAGRDPRAARLGHFYLLAAAAFGRALIRATNLDSRFFVLHVLTWDITGEAFLPLALWQFFRQFPRSPRFTPFDPLSRRVTRVVAAIGIVLFIVNLMLARPEGTLLRELARPVWGLRRTQGGLWFWVIVFSLMLPVLGASIWRLRTTSAEERRRAVWFVVALLAGLFPQAVTAVFQALVPGFHALMTTGNAPARRVVDAITLGAFLSMPIGTAYSVIAHRVLTLRVAIHRSARYALAKYTLSAATALPVLVPLAQIYTHRDWRIDQLFSDGVTMFSVGLTAAGIFVLSVRRRVLRALDRILLGASSDHSKTLTGVLAAISAGRTPREVAFETARQLEAALGVSSVTVFVWDEGIGLRTVHGIAPSLGQDTALLALLSEEPAATLHQDTRIFGLLPSGDREWLLRSRVETLVRIPMAHRAMGGAIGIGPRRHGVALTPDDMTFLHSIATTAGLALSRPWSGDAAASADPHDLGAVECTDCGRVTLVKECSCPATVEPASVPRLLRGRFEVERRLGRGGMGVVYFANDLSLKRAVALKTLPQVSSSASTAMLEEASAMARVEHPNLALIYDVTVWRETPVLVVEYLSGGTLAERLRHGPLSMGAAMKTGVALADALTVLHGADILHRDIKPSNVGFSRTGAPKLMDFGIAKLLARTELPGRGPASGSDDATAWHTALAGTPMYLPPEALAGGLPDVFIDLWGLSLVVLESLLGVYPFRAPERLRDRLPPQVGQFFARALHVKRDQRPGTAAQMAEEMRALALSVDNNARISREGMYA